MAILSIGLLLIYSNSGRFANTTSYAEIQSSMEVLDSTEADPASNEKHSRTDSGSWYSNKWEMYRTLSFDADNNIVIDNHIDTIFRYKYMLIHDTLWIVKTKTDLIANKIKYANKNELVLENFLDSKWEMRYTRTNNSPNK